jgi:hypothetical protein
MYYRFAGEGSPNLFSDAIGLYGKLDHAQICDYILMNILKWYIYL